MDSVGLVGDEHPGILNLGIVESPKILLSRAIDRTMRSLMQYRSGEKSMIPGEPPEDSRRVSRGGKRFQPKRYYRSADLGEKREKALTVAIMPFLNHTKISYAGEIMARHFMRRLWEVDDFEVVEQGILRQELLKVRIIMEDGLSVPQAEALFSLLDVDLILLGDLLEYQDQGGISGNHKVRFSVHILEKKSRRSVWNSASYNRGDDGVFFFDRGKIGTTHELASVMARAVVERILRRDSVGTH
jgi:hypothetical protein